MRKEAFFREKIFQTHPPTPDPELFTKNPLAKKAKTDRTLKNVKTGGTVPRKKSATKTNPLIHTQKFPKRAGLWGVPCLSPLGAFRAFSEQLSEFSLAYPSFAWSLHSSRSLNTSSPVRTLASKAKKKKQKKTWGGEKPKVRVKKGL